MYALDAAILRDGIGYHRLETRIVISQGPQLVSAAFGTQNNIVEVILSRLDLFLGVGCTFPILGMAGDAREVHHVAIENDGPWLYVVYKLLEGAKACRFLTGPDVEIGAYEDRAVLD